MCCASNSNYADGRFPSDGKKVRNELKIGTNTIRKSYIIYDLVPAVGLRAHCGSSFPMEIILERLDREIMDRCFY